MIDETGNVWSRLTVLKQSKERQHGCVCWYCRCECGNFAVVSGSSLRQGVTRSCGCLRHKVETGNVYGRLIVLAQAEHDKFGKICWYCHCECGSFTTTTGSCLRNGDTRSCGCLLRESRVRNGRNNALSKGQSGFNALYGSYEKSAKSRGYIFELTKEDFSFLTKMNCHYCGAKPNQESKAYTENSVYIYNGLDRVNNTKGYTMDNVVACCKQCNYSKRNITKEEFLAWARRVVKYNPTKG